MKRRDLLVGTAAAGVGAAATAGAFLLNKNQNTQSTGGPSDAEELAAPAVAANGGARELKLVTTWPKNFPGLGTSAERWAQRITAMSGGRLNVKVFAAGEMVPPFESFDAVSSGTADMYHGAEYYWQGKSTAFNFFAAVPFGLTATEMSAWIHHAGGQALWDELSSGFNIKPMLVANTGVQMGGWFNKEINTVEDYKGLKIRMPGLGGEVLRRIGAAAVSLPGGEIFPALQSGAIDATEWVGPWNDLAFGFYKVAKFYYYPGFHEPGTSLSGGVNLDLWNSLSSEEKAIIEAAATAENDYSLAEFNARNGDALATLVNEHGVELRKFSDDVMTAIGTAAGEVVAEVAAADPMTQKVYDSFIDFRTKAIGWARIADQAYANARELPYTYSK